MFVVLIAIAAKLKYRRFRMFRHAYCEEHVAKSHNPSGYLMEISRIRSSWSMLAQGYGVLSTRRIGFAVASYSAGRCVDKTPHTK